MVKRITQNFQFDEALPINARAVVAMINAVVGVAEVDKTRFHTCVYPAMTPSTFSRYSITKFTENKSSHYRVMYNPSGGTLASRSHKLRSAFVRSIVTKENPTSYWEGTAENLLTSVEQKALVKRQAGGGGFPGERRTAGCGRSRSRGVDESCLVGTRVYY